MQQYFISHLLRSVGGGPGGPELLYASLQLLLLGRPPGRALRGSPQPHAPLVERL